MTRFPFVARHLFDKSNGESRQNKAPPGACFGKSAGALRAGTSADFPVWNSVSCVFMGFFDKRNGQIIEVRFGQKGYLFRNCPSKSHSLICKNTSIIIKAQLLRKAHIAESAKF